MKNIFESLNETSSKATDSTEAYFKATLKYVKLKIFEQLTFSVSLMGKIVLIAGLLLIGFLFIAMSGAIALGHLLDNMAWGCLIVGGATLLLALLAYKLRYKINNKVIKKMSDKFFDNNDGNENKTSL